MSQSESIEIETVSTVENPVFDVVFLHGLNGEIRGTWTNDQGELWPDWLVQKFPEAGIHLVGYGASTLAKLEKIELNLHERAELILQHMLLDGIGERPLVFICHSLGGITAKEILRIANESADEEWSALSKNTKLVVFLATPHMGAGLAKVADALLPRLKSTHLATLANKDGYLSSLMKSYSELTSKLGIKTQAFYEKHKTGKGVASVLVVDEASANPAVSGCRPTGLQANHIDIVKFSDENDFGYRTIVRMLERTFGQYVVQSGTGAFALNGFSDQHATDRRDLLQKLVDAGRQHEYDKANERQNAFASRYIRLGLHDDAKTKADKLLSEVQQRFTDHVYHEKICKDASDEDVMDSIQAKVIDPICEKYGETGDVNALSVQEAMYYLTQKCHIRWDKPA